MFLQKLIDISRGKTIEELAVSTMCELIKKKPEEKYAFLRHVEIKDTRFLEMEVPVTVMSDINVFKSDDVGEALYDIIKTMNAALGRDAGHFFIKELKDSIGGTYYSTIENMGLDLGLMQLKYEVNKLKKNLLKLKC